MIGTFQAPTTYMGQQCVRDAVAVTTTPQSASHVFCCHARVGDQQLSNNA